MTIRIAPSILAADFARLADEVARVEAGGVDLIHVDVMDGHFVPNITMGPPIVAALKRVTALPLDVHLMITDPDRYLDAFAAAGASMITVHVEVLPHLHRTLGRIRQLGLQAGAALNPSTPVGVLGHVAAELDHVLVMAVNPGFTGQSFIPHTLDKVAEVERWLTSVGSRAAIEVDGGVVESNIAALVRAGASIFVAGAALFHTPDAAQAARDLRRAAEAPSHDLAGRAAGEGAR